MADVQPPTVAQHDGWEVQSASLDQPTQEQIVERLSDPTPDDKAEAVAETPAEEEIQSPSTGDSKESATKPVEGEKPKKSSSERTAEIRARIAAETKAYHDARRAREAEEAEYQRIRREREQLTTKPAATKDEKPTDGGKPEWSKYEAEGKDYDQYQDDRDAWNRRQFEREWTERQKTQQAEDTKRRQQYEENRFEEAYQSRLDTVIEKHPDFLELVEQNLVDVPQSPFVTAVVKGHDQGAEVLYYLAQNPDEARVLSTLEPSRAVREAIRISKTPSTLMAYFAQHPGECDRLSRMAPPDALVALGELNAQLKGAKAGSPAETISKAKAPIRPVGGSRSASPKDPDDLPFGTEWIRAENARDRERRRLQGTL